MNAVMLLAVLLLSVAPTAAAKTTPETTTPTARAAFQSQGSLYSTEGMVTIAFTVDTQQFVPACQEMHASIVNHFDRSEWWEQEILLAQESVERACRSMQFWPGMVQSALHSRPRRQVLLAAAAGTVFGSVVIPEVEHWLFGGATSATMDKTQIEIDRLVKAVNLLVQKANVQQDAHNCLRINANAEVLTRIIHEYTQSFVTLLSNNRLTPPLLSLEAADEAWNLYRNASDNRNLPFGREFIYEMPASYQVTDNKVHVLLHLPIIQEEYEIYRYQPFPMPHPDGPVFLRAPHQDLLAVNGDRTKYVLVGLHQLVDCLQLGRAYLCDVAIVSNDWKHDCLPALYRGEEDAVADLCELRPVNVPWVLSPAGGGRDGLYHLWTRNSMSYQQDCLNGSSYTGKWEPGESYVLHDQNCSLAAAGFLLSPRKTVAQNIAVVRTLNYTGSFRVTAQPKLVALPINIWHDPQVGIILTVAGSLLALQTVVVLCALRHHFFCCKKKEN